VFETIAQTSRSYLAIASAIVIAGVLIAASLLFVFTRPAQTTTTTQTTTSIVTTTLILPCDLPVWNSSQTSSNGTPVLLMQPNSTAYVCVTYQSSWQGNVSQYRGEYFTNGTYQFGLYISKEHCTTNAEGGSCTGASFSNSFTISVPVSIRPSASTDYVTAVFTIRSLGNSTGFYDGSAPFDYCSAMPMAVGYTASQVNASDFAPRIVPPCAFLLFAPSSVSVGGMNVTYITF
jgi:hypothetical protein